MNLQNGLKRIYVVLAALWGVFWPVFYVGDQGISSNDVGGWIFIGASILSSPLIYLALVGLTKTVVWVVAGFKTEPTQL
jgi:hypothetical protein